MFNIEIFQGVLALQIKCGELSQGTADYYIGCLKKLNEECIDERVNPTDLERAIYTICKDNHQGLKYIAAIKKYEKEVLGSSKILLYGEALTRLYQKYKNEGEGKEISLEEKQYLRKINRLENHKLKLALRLQHSSGLRISEIAALDRTKDISFGEDKKITLTVRNGKGRKMRIVDVMDDDYLYDKLQEHIAQLKDKESLFYSSSYLKKKAGEYGIQTHDLRRVNSRLRYREERACGATVYEAKSSVGKELGHNSTRVTKLYLGKEK